VRFFSNPFGKTVQQEFGQEFNQDDFLPDREALEIEHQMQNESRIALNRRPDDMLRHETDYNGILYKYDLPTENFPIVFRSMSQLAEREAEERLTSTENLMETLDCDRDTAFESFTWHQRDFMTMNFSDQAAAELQQRGRYVWRYQGSRRLSTQSAGVWDAHSV
jgi:hypothetical protein